MKYLIIGAVAGGATVAARLRRLDEDADIVLFERGEYVSYANCGLPYYIGNTIKERDNLFLQTPEGFRKRFRIEVRTGHEVTGIDLPAKTVEVKELATGKAYTETYDKLVLSPGAEPIRPSIPGIDSNKIFTLRNIPDTDKLKAMVASGSVRRALVVGGGFIGLEMAENFKEAGLEVTVVEMANQVMAPLDYSMAAMVHELLREKGVNLVLEDGVSRFEETSSGLDIHLKSGKVIATDMVLLSIGVTPETKLAREAGLETGKLGGIVVDKFMQTSDSSVYALGDAIEVINPITDKPARIPLAGPANKQGRIVADNIVNGNQEEYEGTIGTSIAKIFDLTVGAAGANAKLLKREQIPYISSFTHASSHAGYYPGALPLSIKILFSPGDGKLLGAQVVGYDGVDKRIDLFAQVIRNSGTVYDLTKIEHAYAPPYSSAKDPVNMAGYVAENILSGKMKIVHWRDIEKLDKNTVLVDVRTPEEFEMGSIPNAINIPVDELRGRLGELPKDKRIIVSCAVGQRGYLAYRILVQHGFEDVFNLSGGYRTWSAIHPARKNPVAAPVNGQEDSAGVSPDVSSIIEIDACGLQCPGPVVQLKKHYQQLKAGQQIRVKATDPGFGRDISSWCNMVNATLVDVRNRNGIVEAVIRKPEENETDSPSCVSLPERRNSGQTIIVFSNDLDKAIAAFIIANGAAAAGKKVSLFFTFWGLSILRRKKKPSMKKDFLGRLFGRMLPSHSKKLGLSQFSMFGMGSWFMRKVMKQKNVYSLETLIGQARENGVQMIACAMSMDVMGIREEELIDGVEVGGVATYLEQADKAGINLFI